MRRRSIRGFVVFLASRRRRRFVRALPGVAALFFVLIGFTARSDEALENRETWDLIFWCALVVVAVSAVATILTPARTGKRRRLDGFDPVPSRLAYWFLDQPRTGYSHYFTLLASADHLYLSDRVVSSMVKTLIELTEEQRLVVAIEERFARGFASIFDRYPIAEVTSVGAIGDTVHIAWGNETPKQYPLGPSVDPIAVAAAVAAVALPGVAGERSVEQVDVGVVRPKLVALQSVVFEQASDADEPGRNYG